MSFSKRFTASFDIIVGTTSFEFSLAILVFIVGIVVVVGIVGIVVVVVVVVGGAVDIET
jgi:hypothetical protein